MIVEYHEAAFAQVYEKPAADGSFLVVGFNRVGNLLELAFRELDDGTLFVFHAMPCRQKWLDEANMGRRPLRQTPLRRKNG
ncbi:hypothetical protein ACYULU_13105 [Breznakiellaceae bacterium SP9]